MKHRTRTFFPTGACLLLLFVLYTVAVACVDVQPIGPNGSHVGFAALNAAVHGLTGVSMGLYTLTDWLSLAAVLPMLGFAALGLVQLLRRKSLLRVDADILALGIFYVLVLAAYLLFEAFALNYRPVLIEGRLEASYPSSTTMLVLCVMPTAMLQLHRRVRRKAVRVAVNGAMGVYTVGMVLGRAVSGVHWLTDIVGGVLLSAALVTLYAAVMQCVPSARRRNAEGDAYECPH